MRADHGDVAGQFDEAVPRAGRARRLRRAIRGVLLHIAAEVHFHAGPRQHQPRPAPLHFVPADQRQDGGDLLLRGNAPRLEVPHPAQHAGGDVEQALALLPGGLRIVEQGGALGVDLDAVRVASRAIDLSGETVVAVARVAPLQALDLGLGRGGVLVALGLVGRVQPQFAGAAHGFELVGEELHATLIA